MTLREIEVKLKSLYQQLDMMRIYESEMLQQVGRKRFQTLLDDTLDQIKYYQKEREKLIKNDKSQHFFRKMAQFTFRRSERASHEKLYVQPFI